MIDDPDFSRDLRLARILSRLPPPALPAGLAERIVANAVRAPQDNRSGHSSIDLTSIFRLQTPSAKNRHPRYFGGAAAAGIAAVALLAGPFLSHKNVSAHFVSGDATSVTRPAGAAIASAGDETAANRAKILDRTTATSQKAENRVSSASRQPDSGLPTKATASTILAVQAPVPAPIQSKPAMGDSTPAIAEQAARPQYVIEPGFIGPIGAPPAATPPSQGLGIAGRQGPVFSNPAPGSPSMNGIGPHF